MTIAPQNPFPEAQRNVFERGFAPSIPGNRGPLRFEEGVATDTDVPNDFFQGAYSDTAPAPTRENHNNPSAFYKPAAQTMQERVHVGSASWIEAPVVLGDFMEGAMAGEGMPQFEYAFNDGARHGRQNPTVVYD